MRDGELGSRVGTKGLCLRDKAGTDGGRHGAGGHKDPEAGSIQSPSQHRGCSLLSPSYFFRANTHVRLQFGRGVVLRREKLVQGKASISHDEHFLWGAFGLVHWELISSWLNDNCKAPFRKAGACPCV